MTRLYAVTVVLFISGLVLPDIYAQSGRSGDPVTIPEALLRPLRGETPRYPRDKVIGELGQGTAPERAWRYARAVSAALVAGRRNSSALSEEDNDLLEGYFSVLRTFSPRSYNLGGGRTEVDGSVSFLVRFLGREQWMTGEIYLRMEENNWRLDDIVLEEVRSMGEEKNTYTYDFSPYERFF